MMHISAARPTRTALQALSAAFAATIVSLALFGVVQLAGKMALRPVYQRQTVAGTLAPSGDAQGVYRSVRTEGTPKLSPLDPKGVAGE
jgi:hypothetical protein